MNAGDPDLLAALTALGPETRRGLSQREREGHFRTLSAAIEQIGPRDAGAELDDARQEVLWRLARHGISASAAVRVTTSAQAHAYLRSAVQRQLASTWRSRHARAPSLDDAPLAAMHDRRNPTPEAAVIQARSASIERWMERASDSLRASLVESVAAQMTPSSAAETFREAVEAKLAIALRERTQAEMARDDVGDDATALKKRIAALGKAQQRAMGRLQQAAADAAADALRGELALHADRLTQTPEARWLVEARRAAAGAAPRQRPADEARFAAEWAARTGGPAEPKAALRTLRRDQLHALEVLAHTLLGALAERLRQTGLEPYAPEQVDALAWLGLLRHARTQQSAPTATRERRGGGNA